MILERLLLAPQDVTEFDQLLDELPFKWAKGLSLWMDRLIIAQTERDRIEAEIRAHRAVAAEQQPSAFDELERQLLGAQTAPPKIH